MAACEPPLQRLSLAFDGGVMSALALGDPARPVDVVFAHANGFNAQAYADVLAPLGASRRVVALDLRGHGFTRLPADPRGHRSWRVFARDIAAALDALDATDVVLAGHSMGATAALLAAADVPDRIRSLALFEPVAVRRTARWTARLPWGPALIRRRLPWAIAAARRRALWPDAQAAFAGLRGRGVFKTWPDQRLRNHLEGGLREVDAGVALACAPAWEAANYAAQGHDVRAALRRLRRPAAIWLGEHGSTWSLRAAARGGAGPIDVEVVAGASHFLPFERPDLVVAALAAASR